MSALALKAYRSAAVDVRCTDADKRDLVIMMYDGAIEAIRLARAHAERTERRSVSASVSRALAILNGLRETLDVQKGGSVASHLDDFYQFLIRKLVRAGGAADTADLAECEDLLGQVREAWASINPATVGQVNQRMFVVRT
ncbi:MAG: flagellar export chaperone FliS [Acidibacter sp.]|nr:flagellar export chaperone FliS [Acidibacter sp.]